MRCPPNQERAHQPAGLATDELRASGSVALAVWTDARGEAPARRAAQQPRGWPRPLSGPPYVVVVKPKVPQTATQPRAACSTCLQVEADQN